MENQTCKTCRWWGAVTPNHRDEYLDDDFQKQPLSKKRCGCPKVLNTCNVREKEVDRLPADFACYSDCEEYDADFRTGPDFGCIHHEPAQ